MSPLHRGGEDGKGDNRYELPSSGARIRDCIGSTASAHAGRGARCVLIVFIDDATSRLTALRCAPAESTKATMETLWEHVAKLGRLVSVYSDKHSIFKVDRSG